MCTLYDTSGFANHFITLIYHEVKCYHHPHFVDEEVQVAINTQCPESPNHFSTELKVR